jgi:electron transfer flavoprotein beta subunit
MHIVVLAKASPGAAVEARFAPELRVERTAGELALDPNDEHAVEAALRIGDADPAVRTTLLTMGPEAAWAGLRKAIAAGIDRSVLISDTRLENSCILSTAMVLAAALAREPFDLVIGGQATTDGGGGVIVGAVAALLGLPCIPEASDVSIVGREVHARQEREDGFDVIAAPLPALIAVTQSVGAFRYPTLRSIVATRSQRPELLTLDDLGLDARAVGSAAATTVVIDATAAEPRSEAQVISGDPRTAARAVADFLAARGFVP